VAIDSSYREKHLTYQAILTYPHILGRALLLMNTVLFMERKMGVV